MDQFPLLFSLDSMFRRSQHSLESFYGDFSVPECLILIHVLLCWGFIITHFQKGILNVVLGFSCVKECWHIFFNSLSWIKRTLGSCFHAFSYLVDAVCYVLVSSVVEVMVRPGQCPCCSYCLNSHTEHFL